MANNEYLNDYLQFFQYFNDTFDPSDQLPVKLTGYKLFKKEVVGAIFNWTNQYLGEKKCPYHLISFLSRIVIEKTRKRCKKQPIQCGFNPSENAYEPLKLMHTVIEVTNEVCFSYKLSLNVQNTRQNMAVSNPLPPPEAVYNVVSVSALKNSRRKMEDRHIVVHDLNTIFTKQDATPSHYYAVFDGHDGEDAAAYSANHLHQYLAESTNFTTEPEQALRDAFCRTDSMFLNKCESENIVGGTTAVCALLLPKEKTLYIAWTGDSQAALVSQGKIKQCVKPHKPDREDERIRIEKEGGVVIHWGVWRVNGQLGVSRAIGDSQYKPYVTAVPEIVKIPLGPEDDFFVLGSDGLWDHVSETDIAKVVYDMAYSNPDKADLVSRDLVQLAKCNGSSDNISVIVVFLRHPRNIAAGPRCINIVVGMEALDNANDPFVVPNKANGDAGMNEHNTDEGLLLNNINDGFEVLKKKDDMPNNDLIKMLEKSNCARLTPEFDKDDNLGPETDVDNPDDGMMSPNLDAMSRRSEVINNNQHYNPFNDIEKSLELNLKLKDETFDELTTPDEETCPPPINSVHNVSQLIDAGAESDSEEEEEWNYVSGQEANKENIPSQLNSKVAEEEEEDDTEETMSQLNPNAAEFVPVSPTRAVASPIGRLLSDEVLSQSPKRAPAHEEDLSVPNPVDFEKDISQKPHEIDEGISNGHQNDSDMEVIGPANNVSNRLDEFHFGPNAAPFTPIKLLDQSEASSTRAVFGDESVITLGTSFNDSHYGQDDLDRADLTAKDDPMSVSFHQDREDDSNPFDLNKVHILPDDEGDEVEEGDFVARGDLSNSLMNDTISDLAEHFPLRKPEEENKPPVEFLVTDLDHDDNRSSSENRIMSPVKSDRTESPLEDSRTESPLEQDRVSIPFEEERAVSPIQEHKVSSHFEDRNLFSTLVGKDSAEDERECLSVEKKESSILIGEKEDSHNEDREINSPVQDKKVSSVLGETETSYVIEKEMCTVEDEKMTYPEGDKEKCTIEEKEVSSPLEEDKEKFAIEENSPFEVKKEKLMVEEKEVSSPLGDEDELSLIEARAVKSPVEERTVKSPVEIRDVVSPIEERSVTSPVTELIATPLVQEEVMSFSIGQKSDTFSVEQKSEIFPVEEKSEVFPEQKAEIFPIEQKSEILPVQQMSEVSVEQASEIFSAEHKSDILVVEQKSEILSVEEPKISVQSGDERLPCSSEDDKMDLAVEEPVIEVNKIHSLLEGNKIEENGVDSSTFMGEIMNSEENLIGYPAKFHIPIRPDDVSTIFCHDRVERSSSLMSDNKELGDIHITENTGIEKLDDMQDLDVENTVASSEKQRDIPEAATKDLLDTLATSDLPAEPDSSCDVMAVKTLCPELVVQTTTAEPAPKVDEKEAPLCPPNKLPLSPTYLDDPLHSHPTPECDQLLMEARAPLESSVDTESVTTTEVNSFLGRSLLQEMESPLSSNESYVLEEPVVQALVDVSSVPPVNTSTNVSPERETPKAFLDLTSTPSAGRPISLSPIAFQVLADVPAKSPTKLPPKEAEKKASKAGKTTPSIAAAKKAPTPRTSLSAAKTSTTPAAKTATPSPRAAALSKTSRPIPAKTDSGAASKAPSKPAAVPKTTAARLPPSSRPLMKPTSNGDSKTAPKTNTGATKKSTEGSASSRSTNSTIGSRTASTGTSKTLVASARSATTTGSAATNRGVTTTSAPKPRPNTLKPAVSRTATATKSTSAVKPSSTTTTLKAPTAAKPSSFSSNRAPISRSSQPRPAHTTTEKQIKETANKLTASRTTTTTKTSATTRKSEEKVNATKMTASRTTPAAAAAASTYRPPIRRPPASTDAKAAATKVGKPKQNGVAAVITEQIIVNKTQEQGAELNGLSNGDGRFVKDNSPVDNKLIVDSNAATETAAN